MEVEIIQRPAHLYIGQTRPFTMDTTDLIAKFWQEFFGNIDRIQSYTKLPSGPDAHCLGICFMGDGYKFDYMIAYPMKDEKPSQIPADMQIYMLPAQMYLVLPAPGAKENIQIAYQFAFDTWFPQQSEWEHDLGKPDFEYYPPEFNDFQPDSMLYIYIPIRKKG